MNSEPCSECTKLIKSIGFSKVIYSNEQGNLITKKSFELDGTHVSKGMQHLKHQNKRNPNKN